MNDRQGKPMHFTAFTVFYVVFLPLKFRKLFSNVFRLKY